jgi:hypothetical protein
VSRPVLAITVRQPRATCIAEGWCQVEGRSEPFDPQLVGAYVAIHASRDCNAAIYQRLLNEGRAYGIPARAMPAPEEIPLGAVVAVARVLGAVQVEAGSDFYENKVTRRIGDIPQRRIDRLRRDRWIEARRWVWVLDEATKLKVPIPAIGYPKVWHLHPQEAALVRSAWADARRTK